MMNSKFLANIFKKKPEKAKLLGDLGDEEGFYQTHTCPERTIEIPVPELCQRCGKNRSIIVASLPNNRTIEFICQACKYADPVLRDLPVQPKMKTPWVKNS